MRLKRYARSYVRLRRWRQRPEIARQLHRLRRALPFVASAGFNALLIFVLFIGYQSFVAKGMPDAGPGQRVVAISFFSPPEDQEEQVPEVREDDAEQVLEEEAEMGVESIPEGNALTDGDAEGEQAGDDAPNADLGEDIAVAKAGIDIPSIALPDIDAGEGRPEGFVGVDCYAVFEDQDKARECAGRAILSGWRAELADLGEDWDRFAEELGTERRQIRYGPLRGSVPNSTVSSYRANPYAVPREVRALYAAELEARRRAEAVRRFELQGEAQVGTEALQDSQDAANYDPAAPSISLPQPSIFFEEPGGDQ
ncbi:MAG: hypothetical protein AAF511_06735 [Pseudomonadota bacterium]